MYDCTAFITNSIVPFLFTICFSCSIVFVVHVWKQGLCPADWRVFSSELLFTQQWQNYD